ncbi:MAG: 16S rRNA (cytosine(1402)-N(4))-methyltransferase [Nitrospirales bacterium]|nr:16S rRNA (cytosine(1402)-N(4))-methyltransferase [Nitrospirales bacterium]
MQNEKIHLPVLLDEVLEMLSIKPDGVYLDGTVGLGGHSAEILKRIPGCLPGPHLRDSGRRHPCLCR